MQQAVQPEIQQTVQSDVQQAAQPELQQVALPDVSQAVQTDGPAVCRDKQMDLQSVENPQTSSQQSPFSKHLAMPKPKTENKTLKKIKLPKAVTGEAFRKIMLEKKNTYRTK
jgi:hypothetical protein